uniref:Uncharacterized protein n=1 Tax=Populus trichocarpa TaxID=3694 RepID=U5G063_POPTR
MKSIRSNFFLIAKQFMFSGNVRIHDHHRFMILIFTKNDKNFQITICNSQSTTISTSNKIHPLIYII